MAVTAEEVAIPELPRDPAYSAETVTVAWVESAAPVAPEAWARWERVLTRRVARVATVAYPACLVSAALRELEALEV